MLQPNSLPHKEPDIDVGIVLPEDQLHEISITIPGKPRYNLITAEEQEFPLEPDSKLQFQLRNGQIAANYQNSSLQAKEYIAAPSDSGTLHEQSGLYLRGVIAGRNFHWQKKIDVYLPGSLRIFAHDRNLIVINRLPFEQYVTCVATSEMSAACPQAFLEAQTIAARSWMLANVEQKHRHLGMDVCNDDCCQRYQGSSFLTPQATTAAKTTSGSVLLFGGQICDARYSKSCGGMMEAFESVWPGAVLPYLHVKRDTPEDHKVQKLNLKTEIHFLHWLDEPPDAFCGPKYVLEKELPKYLGSVDEQGEYFRWDYSISQMELLELLNRKIDLQARQILAMKPIVRGGSGRVTKLHIEYIDRLKQRCEVMLESEYAIRAALHEHFLYSSAITIEPVPANADIPLRFHIRGCGWGHGVGLCQIGALGMALAGKSSKEILAHYYPGANLKQIYS
ncbi:MAG: SpoIID/LytB domain-containing protein [bacterium]